MNTYFGISSRLSRSEPPRLISRVDVFCSGFGVFDTDVDDACFGARPRPDDVDVFKLDDFSIWATSLDGVDARESLSLAAVFVSGFFGLAPAANERI